MKEVVKKMLLLMILCSTIFIACESDDESSALTEVEGNFVGRWVSNPYDFSMGEGPDAFSVTGAVQTLIFTDDKTGTQIQNYPGTGEQTMTITAWGFENEMLTLTVDVPETGLITDSMKVAFNSDGTITLSESQMLPDVSITLTKQ